MKGTKETVPNKIIDRAGKLFFFYHNYGKGRGRTCKKITFKNITKIIKGLISNAVKIIFLD